MSIDKKQLAVILEDKDMLDEEKMGSIKAFVTETISRRYNVPWKSLWVKAVDNKGLFQRCRLSIKEVVICPFHNSDEKQCIVTPEFLRKSFALGSPPPKDPWNTFSETMGSDTFSFSTDSWNGFPPTVEEVEQRARDIGSCMKKFCKNAIEANCPRSLSRDPVHNRLLMNNSTVCFSVEGSPTWMRLDVILCKFELELLPPPDDDVMVIRFMVPHNKEFFIAYNNPHRLNKLLWKHPVPLAPRPARGIRNVEAPVVNNVSAMSVKSLLDHDLISAESIASCFHGHDESILSHFVTGLIAVNNSGGDKPLRWIPVPPTLPPPIIPPSFFLTQSQGEKDEGRGGSFVDTVTEFE